MSWIQTIAQWLVLFVRSRKRAWLIAALEWALASLKSSEGNRAKKAQEPAPAVPEKLELPAGLAVAETEGFPMALPRVPQSPAARENVFDSQIAVSSAKWGVPTDIVKAVIFVESTMRPGAVREEPRINDRSRGLMQVLERTARGLGFTGPFDLLFSPAVNVDLGTKLLRQLHERFGNWEDALAAYNGGYPRRDAATGQLEDRLQTYVDKVRNAQRRFTGGSMTSIIRPSTVASWTLLALAAAALLASRLR